ncbi:hypothetical protein P3T76_016404 [Phytophthora citrophthora]|uniref:Uncharacterized protein n=1 Tax=Phytophthora citrophthora TaxID=4793 RepID=A0AAD9FXM1_9STRA|nr:hypothetical protein P3T76_016404 [Phytophthora citrophthora]
MERCERKSGMANIVFYEVIIVRRTRLWAQFQDSRGKTPEYGPRSQWTAVVVPRADAEDDFPAGCRQFNGETKTWPT